MVHPSTEPAAAPAATVHEVAVEVVALSVRGGRLHHRETRTGLGQGEQPDAAAARAAGLDPAPGTVLHSTSWRVEDGAVVLVYALFPAVNADGDAPLEHHVVTGPDAVRPTPLHVAPAHVAAHAVRHLGDLADGRDPHVGAAVLAQPGAWRVLLEAARGVHLDDGPALSVVDAALDAARPGLADLAARCAQVDGHSPFEEHTLLTLDGPRQLPHARVELRDADRLLGCVLLSEGTAGWALEAAVDPALRGRGWGRRLLAAARDHVRSHGGGTVTAWLHGDAGAAQAVAASWDARTARRLLVLERDLDDLPPRPAGVRTLDVRQGAERDAWLRLTNAAFDGHPDNGGWTRAELDWRMDAAWTDGARLPVVEDAGRLVAGVWTKVEPGSADGELYVVAVAPDAQGRGLGRVVVAAALHALRDAACRRALLYVDADNAPALALYGRAGFAGGVEHRCVEAVVPG